MNQKSYVECLHDIPTIEISKGDVFEVDMLKDMFPYVDVNNTTYFKSTTPKFNVGDTVKIKDSVKNCVKIYKGPEFRTRMMWFASFVEENEYYTVTDVRCDPLSNKFECVLKGNVNQMLVSISESSLEIVDHNHDKTSIKDVPVVIDWSTEEFGRQIGNLYSSPSEAAVALNKIREVNKILNDNYNILNGMLSIDALDKIIEKLKKID